MDTAQAMPSQAAGCPELANRVCVCVCVCVCMSALWAGEVWGPEWPGTAGRRQSGGKFVFSAFDIFLELP